MLVRFQFALIASIQFPLLAFAAVLPSEVLPNGCHETTKRFDTFLRRGGQLPKPSIDTISSVRPRLQAAVKATDAALESGKIPLNDPEAYRNFVSRELLRPRAEIHAKLIIGQEILEGRLGRSDVRPDKIAIEKRRAELVESYLLESPQETILVLDTPLTDSGGNVINRPGINFVVDHHGNYLPPGALDNTGYQILARFKQALEDNDARPLKSIEAFHRSLTGNAKNVTYSSDNLGDGAEVIAILKSPVILDRLAKDPELIEMLMESGRYTDFFVFRGNRYEKDNVSERSRRAILLSKAIMHNHSRLLRVAEITFGDRIEANRDPGIQRRLLQTAVEESERLILEATSPDFSSTNPGRVGAVADEFDQWRGGPQMTKMTPKNPKSPVSSFEMAEWNHRRFALTLPKDLRVALSPEKVGPALVAMDRDVFGHRPVTTGHQFADWSAASIANENQSGGPKPIRLELGGKEPTEMGKPVILSKAAAQEVNLKPIADALNEAARRKFRKMLEAQRNTTAAKIDRLVADHTEFTSRGPELVFNFGGHSLTRAEISAIVGETLANRRRGIFPLSAPP